MNSTDDYDAAADMAASIEECYRAIRERMARGGPPWVPPEVDKRWHAARFRRAADRHDWRIPFETRVAVLARADEHCEHCGRFIATGFTVCLELHHLTYERAYGKELPEDLMALCRECHAGMHQR